jgi:hypothetical protein
MQELKQITPHQYLRQLKELLASEKEKIILQKELALKSNNYETAALYRDIEKYIIDFVNNLKIN